MSIDIKKYVRIVSGVGGGAAVRTRDLIGRIFTSNPLVSPDSVLEFSSAANVGAFFGLSSEEYKRAAVYFAYVSPNIAAPRRLSFARWAETGTSATVFGSSSNKALASIQAIVAGGFSVKLGSAAPFNVAAVNLSGAASMAAAATILQTALRAAGGAPAVAATVTFTNNRFVVTFPGTLGTIAIASTAAGVNDIATILGLTVSTDGLPIVGVAPQTPLAAFAASVAITNNFGTFLFMDSLDLAEVTSLAAANAALNIMFMYVQRVAAGDAAAWSAALLDYAGIGLTLAVEGSGEYPEQFPMMIAAATDYTKRNATQNYMYRQAAGFTPTVSDDAASDLYDRLRVNYYGQTATAGQRIEFYQRGTLMGTSTSPTDMNVYMNEAWLKDFAASELLALQLGIGRIPANDTGRAMIGNSVQGAVDRALFNGTISVGKTLNNQQKAFITQQTGDELAWRAVQDVGYVLSVTIEPYTTTSGAVEYKAVYSLIYAKDDAVRLIEGTHSLI